MPPWYLKDPETAHKWKLGLTTVDSRIAKQAEVERLYGRLLRGEEKLTLKPSGEEEVRQLKGLVGLQSFVTNVNLPNAGQLQGIPFGAVVETNAVFSGDSLRPVLAGELPTEVNSLVLRHVLNQETTLQAALKRDPAMAFRAFINDPLVTLPPDRAEELFRTMLLNTKAYLPGWKL
ncbi:family 4 glycosyl hydrolase [Paenibacillus puerhi]|uniref:family 4 glycosyl hydrolase n=1 Tax=Paenibacillus puerhi TaxID=2692622 RepID=UPI00135CC527|nr:hypothetical protein [Paenibacillus puerhi]